MVKRHVYDVRFAALYPHNHGRCKSTLESRNRQLSTVNLWLWNCAGKGLTFLFLVGDFMLNTIMVMQRLHAEWKKKTLNMRGPPDSEGQVQTSEVSSCPRGICCVWPEGIWDFGGWVEFFGSAVELVNRRCLSWQSVNTLPSPRLITQQTPSVGITAPVRGENESDTHCYCTQESDTMGDRRKYTDWSNATPDWV